MSAASVASRIDALDRIGALKFGEKVAQRHGVELDEALDMKCQTPSARRARRELLVVTMHTLGLGYGEAGRVFGTDHTTLMMAERRWDNDRRRAIARARA